MARSINSPGVQITETDLSLNQQFGGATNIFVAGYAPQGPTDEVLLISSVSELEQVYGAPQTAAERYFYYTSKEILNTPATLLTTRLPYGSGTGLGFSTQYTALFYPVILNGPGYKIGTPEIYNLTQLQYDDLIQGNFNWSPGGGIISSTQVLDTVTPEPSSALSVTPELSTTVIESITGLPEYEPDSLDIEIDDDGLGNEFVNFTYTLNISSFITLQGGTANYSFSTRDAAAGLIVLNKAQTTINQAFEGYYISFTDNSDFGPETDFTAVNNLKSYSSFDTLYDVPPTLLSFTLSSTRENLGSNSISELIEGIPTYNFSDSYFRDSVILNVYKIRRSIYEPELLTFNFAETYIGSLDSQKRTVANIGGIQKTFFLQDVVNEVSPNIQLLVNPNISNKTNWTSLSSTTPDISLTVDDKSITPLGSYLPTFTVESNKQIGSVQSKVERALTLIESLETVTVDVIPDAGLSTIYATTGDTEAFNEAKFIQSSEFTDVNSNVVAKWRSLFSVFNNFVSNVRKDCMYISDPIRQIFVNGENTKVLSVRNNTFSTNVYAPLRNIYSTANSNYSAAYANWLKYYDAYSDKQVWIPASGPIAGIYARTDANTQPWIAPAGFNRGQISNAIDIAFNPNQKQRDFLYTIALNPVVSFQGEGITVFGQKTLQTKPSAFDRVNVRRLFLTLERAVMSTIKYFVFEPNTQVTRTRVKGSITPIFELAKNTEGLFDYLIVCDERNNTPDVIDRNELAVDIYLKPVRAAEFILVNFIATRTNQSFSEII